jgi:hypothetical protein
MTSPLKVDVLHFDDGMTMLNVVADGAVRAWHEDQPITLSSAGGWGWYLGTFAVAPGVDHAKLEVEIDGVPRNLVARWPEQAPLPTPAPTPKRRRSAPWRQAQGPA